MYSAFLLLAVGQIPVSSPSIMGAVSTHSVFQIDREVSSCFLAIQAIGMVGTLFSPRLFFGRADDSARTAIL